MKFLLIRSFEYGVERPWWMGLVNHQPMRRRVNYAPIPLNVLYRLTFLAWIYLRHPVPRPTADSYNIAFMRGREFERTYGPGFMPWRLKGYWLGFKAGRLASRINEQMRWMR